ncbi:hypothetical protein [Apilactobacillus timberlakei]|uniref:hypothetical protein n=1 Tax=Apilactobacillus timberlakei TaxID=2008380 RepID=UPI00112C362F|nr:hypothetical protein [Apilactobacillus timberlakei]TPR16292.1 hypothetical protein DYZ95_07950 [Apilactobacillus timberlakei]TPR21537.1 hypothetical protein DY083_05820 [Apilactobacillus timberlakei]
MLSILSKFFGSIIKHLFNVFTKYSLRNNLTINVKCDYYYNKSDKPYNYTITLKNNGNSKISLDKIGFLEIEQLHYNMHSRSYETHTYKNDKNIPRTPVIVIDDDLNRQFQKLIVQQNNNSNNCLEINPGDDKVIKMPNQKFNINQKTYTYMSKKDTEDMNMHYDIFHPIKSVIMRGKIIAEDTEGNNYYS